MSYSDIEPVAEEVVYAEPEPIIQEPDEEPVQQQPQEEQVYEELQPGTTTSRRLPESWPLTLASKVGTLSIILCKSCLTIVCRLCIKFEELIETHLHIYIPPYPCPFDTYLS